MRRLGLAGVAVVLVSSSLARAEHDDRSPDDWSMYNYDVRGTRHNSGEMTLAPWNVSGLHQVWSVPTPAPVTGTPAVVGDELYAGDWARNFYQINARNGHIDWATQMDGPVSASALVHGDKV